jgi:hypothetical protein
MWQSKLHLDVQLADLQKVPSSNCNSLRDSGIHTVSEGYEKELTFLKFPAACKRAAVIITMP